MHKPNLSSLPLASFPIRKSLTRWLNNISLYNHFSFYWTFIQTRSNKMLLQVGLGFFVLLRVPRHWRLTRKDGTFTDAKIPKTEDVHAILRDRDKEETSVVNK